MSIAVKGYNLQKTLMRRGNSLQRKFQAAVNLLYYAPDSHPRDLMAKLLPLDISILMRAKIRFQLSSYNTAIGSSPTDVS